MTRRRTRRLLSGTALAAVLSVLAVAAARALEPATGPTFFGFALAAVAAAVWLGGLGPALLTTFLTALGTALVSMEPLWSFGVTTREDALRLVLFILAALVIAGLGEVMRNARRRAETSERRLTLLVRTRRALEPALELEDALRRLAEAMVPALAGACAMRVRTSADGDESLVVSARAGAPGEGIRWEVHREPVATPERGDGAASARLLRWPSRSPEDDVVDEPALAPLRALEPRAVIVAPLAARGTRLGTIALAITSGEAPYDGEDLALVQEIATTCALQLDNVRLYEAERTIAAALERTDALKTFMLRGVSHELRTPLTAIGAAADALRRAEAAERDELLDIVVEESGRLERVVANLLDLSRLEGGVLHPRLDDCAVAELVAGSRAGARRALEGQEVRVALDGDLPLVRADPVLAERILVNLLQNAVAHGAPPVHVEAHDDGAYMHLVVTDSGAGIAPEVAEAIFEPFLGSRDGGGLGLGLALSRRLAEAQGGRLELLEAPGGARFRLSLPRARTEARA